MDERTISLHAADLSAVMAAWRRAPIDSLVGDAPRGRLAAVLAGPVEGVVIDGGRPAEVALAGVSTAARRAAFEAVVEDLAESSLWDASRAALAEVFAALARIAQRPDLGPKPIDDAAALAYPPDLLDDPFVEHAGSGGGLLLWLAEPGLLEAAARAAKKAQSLPPGALNAKEPNLFHDLVESVAPVLALAARPGHSLIAHPHALYSGGA